MKLEFGIFDHLDRRDQPLSAFYDDRLKAVKLAEDLGFIGYHVAEHHMTPLGMAPSPAVYLAAVARETSKIRIGPLVFLLPLYHPLRLIEEICMLDHMSGGRLNLGVGRGVSPFEVAYFGVKGKDTFSIFRESFEVILNGLTHERLDYKGERFSFDDVPMELRPLQAPYPPLWYGVGGPDSRKFAAEHGMNAVGLGTTDGIVEMVGAYKELWDQYAETPFRQGSPVKQPRTGALRQIYVARTEAEAAKFGHRAYTYWVKNLHKLWIEHGTKPSEAIPGDFRRAAEIGSFIVGTVDQVTEELASQISRSGMNYPLLQFDFGDLGFDRAAESMRLFMSDVAPALRRGA